MSLLVGSILAFIFLDPPARYLVLIPLVVWEFFEVMIYLRWRGVKSITGAEAITGTMGIVTRVCDPEGQARVNGQLWKARSTERLEVGQRVEVTGFEGITLFLKKITPA